jgi:hypothetical protein
VISVHILCLDDCLDTTIMPQPTEITQLIFGQPLRLWHLIRFGPERMFWGTDITRMPWSIRREMGSNSFCSPARLSWTRGLRTHSIAAFHAPGLRWSFTGMWLDAGR